MSVYHRVASKNRTGQEYQPRESEITAVFPRQLNPKVHLENEKRMRREIANSNERRRMQSINAGFQHLRQLIPHCIGEKLSKAAILQQTTDYIKEIQREKSRVSGQNAHLKRLLTELSRRCNVELDIDLSYGSPPTKRKKRDTESSDEGIAADYDDYNADEIRREMADLRQQLDKERQLRIILEKRSQATETHRLSEKIQHQLENQMNVENQIKHERLYAADPRTTHCIDDAQYPHLLRIPAEPMEAVCTSMPDKADSKDAICRSMSRRNLETIVEAIRHLEGDSDVTPEHTHSSDNSTSLKRPISHLHSEESEKDSCITTSDQDDVRSDSSGRDSPSTVEYHKLETMKPYSVHVSSVSSPSHTASYLDKYPAVSNVLHGTAAQFYCRPGVIVQKS